MLEVDFNALFFLRAVTRSLRGGFAVTTLFFSGYAANNLAFLRPRNAPRCRFSE
jgi:hypothetical protein